MVMDTMIFVPKSSRARRNPVRDQPVEEPSEAKIDGEHTYPKSTENYHLESGIDQSFKGFIYGLIISLLVCCILMFLIYSIICFCESSKFSVKKLPFYENLRKLPGFRYSTNNGSSNRNGSNTNFYDATETSTSSEENFDSNKKDRMFEEKWQTERITRKMKQIVEREFIGLKTDLTVDFDERVITVVDKIETMVNVTVDRKVEILKKDILSQLFPAKPKLPDVIEEGEMIYE